jgi:hypothetical protein
MIAGIESSVLISISNIPAFCHPLAGVSEGG